MNKKFLSLVFASIGLTFGVRAYRSQLEWNSYHIHFDQGQAFLKTREFTRAGEEFRLSYESKPDRKESLGKWGNALYYLGKYQEAIEKLEPAVSALPQRGGFRILLAQSYFAVGDDAGAKSEIDYVLHHIPHYSDEANHLLVQMAKKQKAQSNKD